MTDKRSQLVRSEEHTSELQSPDHLVCRLLLEKKKKSYIYLFFFFNDTATTEIYTLSLHDALPISLPIKKYGLEKINQIRIINTNVQFFLINFIFCFATPKA